MNDPEFLKAIETLITSIGENPDREGLKHTPKRVKEAFREYFKGYQDNPATYLQTHFTNTSQYDEPVLLKDIPFYSHCEHHLAPMHGVVSIAYIPDQHIVGISKLARVVQTFSRRLQIQEKLTVDIAHCIQTHLNPKGVAVYVNAVHHCMMGRGVNMTGTRLVSYHFTGVYHEQESHRTAFKNSLIN